MSIHSRIGARPGRTVEVDLAQWSGFDHDAPREERRAQYLMRRKAVEMYLACRRVSPSGRLLITANRRILIACLGRVGDSINFSCRVASDLVERAAVNGFGRFFSALWVEIICIIST